MLKVDNLLQNKIIFRYFTQALNWTQNCLPFFEALFQRVANILVRYFHSFFLIYDFHGQSSSSLGATVYFYKQMNELVQRKTEWMLEQEQVWWVDCPLEFHLKCFRFKMTMSYFLILSMKHLLTKSREEVNLYILLLFLLWYFENDR